MELHFTAHYNWQWVVAAAHEGLRQDFPALFTLVNDCKGFRMLPSMQGVKAKPEYSLIRVDLMTDSETLASNLKKKKIRMTSQGFADLDPKDALFRRLLDTDANDCMPRSVLLAWNCDEEALPKHLDEVPTMLKAPMGSGGFGLYYVYHPRDIFPLLRNHRIRAEKEPNFMENLLKSYHGAQPSWSLQEVITSVKGTPPPSPSTSSSATLSEEESLGHKRRTQIRVYVVICEHQLYVYDGIEVRMPLWDCDIDEVLQRESAQYSTDGVDVNDYDTGRRPWSDPVEEECCGEGRARPYNEQRNKKETTRYMLEEIPELIHARKDILACTTRAFQAMAPSILQRDTADADEVRMAVVGVDLLVTLHATTPENPTPSFRAVMVEVNNNPAMPGVNKQMSEQYRQHLVTMVSSIIQLGVVAAAASISAAADDAHTLTSGANEWISDLRSIVLKRFHVLQ
jgi:hypothetical protein